MSTLKLMGNVAGILGVVLCGVAMLIRLMGTYHLGGVEMMTLFNIGVGGMVLSCLLKLEVMIRGES